MTRGFLRPPSRTTGRLPRPRRFVVFLLALLGVVGLGQATSALGATVSVTDVTVDEADGVASFSVSVAFDLGDTLPVTMDYATSNGTAAAGSDYAATGASLSFDVGDPAQIVSVPITDDNMDEPSETFFLDISNVGNATPATLQATATITDNDPVPDISITDVIVNPEGHAASTNAVFDVSLTNPSADTITVDFATANRSAIAGADYTAGSGTVTFPAGTTLQTVTVPVLGDLLDEDDEQFEVNLTNPTGTATVADAQGLGTIVDDDAAPLVIIAANPVETPEAGPNATFRISLTAVSGKVVSGLYSTSDLTALAGLDYTAATNVPFTINPGATSTTINIAVTQDIRDENDQTFRVTLSGLANAGPGTLQADGTIVDDDTTLFTVNTAGATEVDTGGTSAINFTVTRDRPSDHDVTVNYATGLDSTLGANPATANVDYVEVGATALTFQPADGLTAPVDVTVTGDDLDENTETFRLNLTATAGTSAGGPGIGTIADDDVTHFTINSVSQTEVDTPGTSVATFTITRNRQSDHEVTVNYATANDTPTSATANVDYTAVAPTALPFAGSGPLTKTITVTITGDNLDENDETFLVNLTATAGTTAGGPGTGTIVDDDVTRFTVDNVSQTEVDTGGTSVATFTVTRDRQSDHPVSVSFASANDAPTPSALAGTDYTATSGGFTFPADAATADPTRQFDVTIIGDSLDEANETYRVLLTPGPGTTAGAAGVGTIIDDDTSAIAIGDRAQAEGNSGLTPATSFVFPVTLSTPSAQEITVNFSTSDGTATQPADFTSTTGTVTFPAGTTGPQNIVVQVRGDLLDEDAEATASPLPAEDFSVKLANATGGALIADDVALGTITDDDATPSIAIDDVAVNPEGTGATPTAASFTVTASAASGLPITATFASVDGSAVAVANATSPSDYAATSGTITIPAGQTAVPIPVQITADNVDEQVAPETFSVSLTNAGNATVNDATGIASITDDDAPPVLTIASGNVGETEATAAAALTVSLSNPSFQPVSFAYSTANGTATAPADYTAVPAVPQTSVNVPPLGVTAATNVSVAGDVLDENDETVLVTIAAPTNATLGVATQGTLTIVDNDDPPIVNFVTPSTELQTEGNTGVQVKQIQARLTNAAGALQPSGRNVTIAWQTRDDVADFAPNATRLVDYLPVEAGTVAGTLTFAPGETLKSLNVSVIGDTVPEGSESIGVQINSVLDPATAQPLPQPLPLKQLLVIEDDAPNQPPFPNADVVTVERNRQVTFNVRVNDLDPNNDATFVPGNTAPAHGTAFCQSTGNCLYIPTPGYIGPDTFAYTLSDGQAQATGNVSITVVNAKPTANPDATTTSQGTPATINVVANDTDPDGGTLSVVASSPGAQGTVACGGPNCTYTPNPAFIGADQFTYTLSDGTDTVTGTVSVTVSKGKALTAAITVTPGTARARQTVRYRLTITNSNGGPVSVTKFIACVPKGFRYVKGSTTGAVTTNPIKGACDAGRVKLTWSKRIQVQAGKSASLTFQATVGGTPGRAKATAGGAAADQYAVTTSAPSATVRVKARGKR